METNCFIFPGHPWTLGGPPRLWEGPFDFGRDESHFLSFFKEPFKPWNEVNAPSNFMVFFVWHLIPENPCVGRLFFVFVSQNDSFGWIDDFYVSCWECRQGHSVFVKIMFRQFSNIVLFFFLLKL